MNPGKLGLGTVQFGSDYGVSNDQGKPTIEEVARILETASEAGIGVLDCSPVYGDSESILGRVLPPGHRFRIVTKTAPLRADRIGRAEADHVKEAFFRSLENLRQTSVYGLLVHHSEDLLKPGGEHLVHAMQSLVAQGVVQKIGISVYSGLQIDEAAKLMTSDIVQLPLNVLDQRLIDSGHLVRLKGQSVEIHARSVFLQGLLLMDPAGINSYFSSIRAHLERYRHSLKEYDLTPVQAALLFAVNQPHVDTVLVGVCSARELHEILNSLSALESKKVDFSHFAMANESVINPSLWKLHA